MSKVHEFATLLVWYTFIGPLSQYCNVYFTSEATSHGHNAAILSPGISDRLHTWGIVKMILSGMTTTPTWHDSAGVMGPGPSQRPVAKDDDGHDERWVGRS